MELPLTVFSPVLTADLVIDLDENILKIFDIDQQWENVSRHQDQERRTRSMESMKDVTLILLSYEHPMI